MQDLDSQTWEVVPSVPAPAIRITGSSPFGSAQLAMQVELRPNSSEFKFAPDSLDFVVPSQIKFGLHFVNWPSHLQMQKCRFQMPEHLYRADGRPFALLCPDDPLS